MLGKAFKATRGATCIGGSYLGRTGSNFGGVDIGAFVHVSVCMSVNPMISRKKEAKGGELALWSRSCAKRRSESPVDAAASPSWSFLFNYGCFYGNGVFWVCFFMMFLRGLYVIVGGFAAVACI